MEPLILDAVFFHAPKRSGKDTCTDLLMQDVLAPGNNLGWIHEEFKKPLIAALLALTGWTHEEYYERRKRDCKETRALLVALSEAIIKPVLGNEHFGMLAARRVELNVRLNGHGREQIVVGFSDNRFLEELEGFANRMANHHLPNMVALIGREVKLRLWLVYVNRPGHGWATEPSGAMIEPGDFFRIADRANALQTEERVVCMLPCELQNTRDMAYLRAQVRRLYGKLRSWRTEPLLEG